MWLLNFSGLSVDSVLVKTDIWRENARPAAPIDVESPIHAESVSSSFAVNPIIYDRVNSFMR